MTFKLIIVYIRRHQVATMSLLLLLVILLSLFSRSVMLMHSDDKDLILVHVLYRHGDRSPINTFPTDQYQESFWSQGFGQLTEIGMKQHYQLGQYLRNRYINGSPYQLLNSSYSHNQVYVRSTDFDRTLMSAYSNLVGLFPSTQSDVFNERSTWQPIPVHTESQKTDFIQTASHCPKLKTLIDELYKSEELKQIDHDKKDFYAFISEKTGLKFADTLRQIVRVQDPLFCERRHNLSLPNWVDKIWSDGKTTFDKLSELQNLGYALLSSYQQVARLSGGPILADIVKNVRQKIAGTIQPTDMRLFIYSAHDITVASLTSAMKVFNNIQPPYTAAVMVELFNISGQYFVELWYKNDSTRDPYQLVVPGCHASCSFEEFINLLQENILDDWRTGCESDIGGGLSTKSVIAIIAACVSVFLTLLAFIALFIAVRRLRNRPLHPYSRLDINMDD